MSHVIEPSQKNMTSSHKIFSPTSRDIDLSKENKISITKEKWTQSEEEGNAEDLNTIATLIRKKFGLQFVHCSTKKDKYAIVFSNSPSFIAIDGYASENKAAIEFLKANYQATLEYESSYSGLFNKTSLNINPKIAKTLIRHLQILPSSKPQLESMAPDCLF